MKCYYCDGKGFKSVTYWSMMKGEMGPVIQEPCRPCHQTGQLSDKYKNWYDWKEIIENRNNTDDIQT